MRATVFDWVAFHLLPLTPRQKTAALETFGTTPARIAFDVPSKQLLEALGGRRPERLDRARRTLTRQARRELTRCRRLGLLPVPLDSPRYPPRLKEIADPPPLLYIRGDLAPDRVRLAVVGSRRPSEYGRRLAERTAESLAFLGVEIVSGGAMGIDARAHRGALEAGGRTIAVMGSGFEHLYPEDNLDLFERIAGSGAVLSEFPLDARPRARHFPQRNRLISGLTGGVIVIEAALRSGSLSTAGHALEQGREVFAVPGPVHSPTSEGCHRLIQQGAKLVQDVADIVDELPPDLRSRLGGPSAEAPVAARAPGPAGPGEGSAPGMSGDERVLEGMLDFVKPMHLDEIADRAPFGVARLQAALFGLVLRGSVDELTGRYYLRRPRR